MELYMVHTANGAMFVEADGMKIKDGVLVFSARAALLRTRDFLAFGPGAWSACHLANAYCYDEGGKHKIIKAEDVERLVRRMPDADRT